MGRPVLSFTRELDHDLKAEPSEHDDPKHCAIPAIYKDGLKKRSCLMRWLELLWTCIKAWFQIF